MANRPYILVYFRTLYDHLASFWSWHAIYFDHKVYALRIRFYVLREYRHIPIRLGWDWNPKHPIRSGGVWILTGIFIYLKPS